MNRPTQKQINDALWRACDTFRGTIDPAQYKDYVLVTLFWKYISDVHRQHEAELREKYGDNDELVRRKLERDRFVLPDGASFYAFTKESAYRWPGDGEKLNYRAPDLGDRINKALTAIEDANKRKLDGVFRDVDFNSEANLGETKERNRRLRHLIDDFDTAVLDFTPFVEASETGREDVIGNGYQFLIKKFASDSGKKAGDFYTPEEVSMLIARLVAPRAGDRIYDPTCGSGSLLITVADEVRDAEGERSRDFAIYGQELNASTWALAKMNMFVHGIDGATILRGDTITSPKHREGDALLKADVVVANPPFSLKKWGYEEAEADAFGRFKRPVVPPKSKGDYAFLLHMLHSAKQDVGRVGVVVPHGVLFRGAAEGTIREQLLRENLLDAVIGLPAGLFYGTGIPAAVLVFKKRRETTDVLFIDASRAYDDSDTQNRLRTRDIEKIVQTYRAYESVEKYAYRAPFAEIEENDFNLNIPRYVDTFEEEEPVDLEALADEIREIEARLTATRRELDGYLLELGLPA